MRKLAILSIVFSLVCFLLITATSVAASDEDEIIEVMKNFSKAFNTSDSELMLSLHWKSPELSKFTPYKTTIGAFLAQGWETIENDWISTLDQPVGTYNTTLNDPKITFHEGNFAAACGYLVMTINPPAVTEQTSNTLRQTLVLYKVGGKWQIVHEHTSILPAELE